MSTLRERIEALTLEMENPGIRARMSLSGIEGRLRAALTATEPVQDDEVRPQHEGWPLTPTLRARVAARGIDPGIVGCDDSACWCYADAVLAADESYECDESCNGVHLHPGDERYVEPVRDDRLRETIARSLHRHACEEVRRNGGEEGIEWVRWKRLPEWSLGRYLETADAVLAVLPTWQGHAVEAVRLLADEATDDTGHGMVDVLDLRAAIDPASPLSVWGQRWRDQAQAALPSVTEAKAALLAFMGQQMPRGTDYESALWGATDMAIRLRSPSVTEAQSAAWDEAVQATADAIYAEPGRPRWGWTIPINPYRGSAS